MSTGMSNGKYYHACIKMDLLVLSRENDPSQTSSIPYFWKKRLKVRLNGKKCGLNGKKNAAKISVHMHACRPHSFAWRPREAQIFFVKIMYFSGFRIYENI